MIWHILTGEYPPQPGGVSDYTRLVARALADAGDDVTIWAPPCGLPGEEYPGITVRRLPDCFSPRSLWLAGRAFDRARGPKRWLVQYVPHAFGWKAANLPFCVWLWLRRRNSVWVMFHEVAYPSGREYRAVERALAFATRGMAALVGRAAERVFVSIPAWQTLVESLTRPRAPIVWLPVMSSIPCVNGAQTAGDVPSIAGAAGHPLIGHLGTYGRLIRPMLMASVPSLLASTDSHFLLLGRGGDAMRDDLIASHPDLAARIHATGSLSEDALSRHVAACDVMLQPYPDGVSSRRTSVMVALSHGRPVVTTTGRLTEPLWSSCGALVLTAAETPADLATATARLLADPLRLQRLSERARSLYLERFDLAHTVVTLRSA